MTEKVDYKQVIEQFKICFKEKNPDLLPDPKIVIMLIETEPAFMIEVKKQGDMFYSQVCMWASSNLE